MEKRGWQSKGGKEPRRSPRRQKKTCERQFTAPRTGKSPKTVPKGKTSAAQLVQQDGLDTQDSQLKEISETENERDIEARTRQKTHVLPLVLQVGADTEDSNVEEISGTENDRDIQARTEQEPHVIAELLRPMSEREADEEARHGQVLRWSSEEDDTQKTTLESDSTGSTPDILRSPEMTKGRVPGSNETDIINDFVIQASPKTQTYAQGVLFVPETQFEQTEERPVVRSLRNRKTFELSLQQITDCQEGPKGDRAIGVTIAKAFGGYEYRGTVEKFRGETGRYIYHVTYEDGDEEELSQKELRDCYILALSPQIEAQWLAFRKTMTKKRLDENVEGSNEGQSDDQAMSDGEGSLYDKGSDEEELIKKRKKRRKEPVARGPKKGQKRMSGLVLPVPGEKTVAAEAFGKLNASDKELVSLNINKKTKKVVAIYIKNNYSLYCFQADPKKIWYII
jgi:hypothetical protein